MSNRVRLYIILGITVLVTFLSTDVAKAAPLFPIPNVNIGVEGTENPRDVVLSLQILIALTILSIAPAIIIMMTSFTRIVIVLSFIRTAMGTQQMPPTQVMLGLALFLTFFTMNPYLKDINTNAIQPYLENKITQEQALEQGMTPLRTFMFKQTRENDLALFVELSQDERPNTQEDVSTFTLVPAFVISELKTAFQIGFLIYIPFIVIDMVVASTLMSMGMMMVPPVMISLPFKLLLFVLVDGWHLITQSLVTSFR